MCSLLPLFGEERLFPFRLKASRPVTLPQGMRFSRVCTKTLQQVYKIPTIEGDGDLRAHENGLISANNAVCECHLPQAWRCKAEVSSCSF
jgi:hypothetical protein